MVDLGELGKVVMPDRNCGMRVGNILVLNRHLKTGKYYARVELDNQFFMVRDSIEDLVNGRIGPRIKRLVGNPYLVYSSGSTVLFDVNGRTTVIDTEDFDRVKDITWLVKSNRARGQDATYAYGGTWDKESKTWTSIALHRYILGVFDPNIQVDHRDFETTNNKKENLRVATFVENMRHRRAFSNNEVGIRGIRQDKRRGSFQARITVDGKQIYLGESFDIEEAKRLRAEAEERYFGQFSTTRQETDNK